MLAAADGLTEQELRVGVRAAEGRDELLLFCGALGTGDTIQRCEVLRNDFDEIVQALSHGPVDELASLQARILGDLFPAAALAMIPKSFDSASGQNGRQDKALVVIRNAWSVSSAADMLDESLIKAEPTDLEELVQIEFLRLATPSSIGALEVALQSRDRVRLSRAIQAAATLGPTAAELAGPLERIVLDREGAIRRQAAFALTSVAPAQAERLAESLRAEDQDLFLAIKRRLVEQALQ